jgi:hypothetical protein
MRMNDSNNGLLYSTVVHNFINFNFGISLSSNLEIIFDKLLTDYMYSNVFRQAGYPAIFISVIRPVGLPGWEDIRCINNNFVFQAMSVFAIRGKYLFFVNGCSNIE